MAKKNPNVIDIDLSVTKKKQFRIDGDDKRIIELNTSDMLIVNRINEAYPQLESLGAKVSSIQDSDLDTSVEVLKETDQEMRKIIDYIFDSPIADICAPDGSMYDLFNGEFRFDHILSTLLTLYENNITEEIKKMQNNVSKHVSKYTKK